jgi:hypothetical protein
MVLPRTPWPWMEPSPLKAEVGRERVELLGRIRNEVGPLAAAPADAAVIDVHGHPFPWVPTRAGSDPRFTPRRGERPAVAA